MTNTSKSEGTRREQRELSKAKAREIGRRRRLRRNLTYGLAGAATVLVAVAVLVLSGGRSGGTGPSAPGQVQVSGPPRTALLADGQRIPSFSAPALGGGRVEWDQYRGRAVVLALWAPWCPHCQNELPVLGEVAKRFPGVTVVTIATAIGQNPGPSADEFMQDHNLTFPVAIDDTTGKLARAFGLRFFPTLYFVKPDGTVFRAVEQETPASTLQTLFGAIA